MVAKSGKSKKLKLNTGQEAEEDNDAQNAIAAQPKTKRRKAETVIATREDFEGVADGAQDADAKRKKRRKVITKSDDKVAAVDEPKMTKEQTTTISIDNGGRSNNNQGKDRIKKTKEVTATKKARQDADSAKGNRLPESTKDREERVARKHGKGAGKGKTGGRGPKGGEGKSGSGSWSDPKLRVFVHNLDPSCDEALLRRDFSECGELADVYVPTDKATGSGRGFAFITFKTSAGLDAALEYDGTDYGGKTLKVKRALEKGQKPESASAAALRRSEKPEGCTSIVCKRLAPEVTEADLEDFFSDCGAGSCGVGLLRDRATGKSRCTARVDFRSEEDVDEAMTKAAELRGHTFFMDYCRAKN
jgi:RNA recognition motif-containing protein